MAFTRRQFLRQATIAATTAIAPPVLAQQPRRILVVGAGASGLTAAYELMQAGFDVQLFEASDRAGGRMHTLRAPFSNGLYAEAGAQSLAGKGPGIAYAREFGLELLPFSFEQTLGSLAYFKGQRLIHRPDNPASLPFALRPEEQGLSINELHFRYRRAPVFAMENLQSLAPPGLQSEALAELDNTNFQDFLLEQGASEAAIEAMMSVYLRAYADSPELINSLQLIREIVSFFGASGAFSIAGGNDQICGELAQRLGDRVHYRSPVRAIQQTGSGIALSIEGSDGLESVGGDAVIVTPPPPVLLEIDFQPALPESTMNALHAAIGIPVTLTYVQTRSRFWQEQSLDGNAVTDLPVAYIQDMTSMQDNDKGILASMTYSSQAEAMAGLSALQRQQQLRSTLALLYPDSLDLDESGTTVAWGDDPWHRCGHVAFRPGTYVDSIGALRQSHGRLLFAGDTVWGVSGYSHSAFASGMEAATTIMAAA